MNLELSIVEFSNTLQHQHALYELLTKLDGFYIPRVSSQVNLVDYSEKLINNGRVFCVETSKNEYVGLLAVYVNDVVNYKAYISSIGVLPEYQGLGVAEDLLHKAFEVANERGMRSISLEVNIYNQRALGFYKKHGFHENKRVANVFILIKELHDLNNLD